MATETSTDTNWYDFLRNKVNSFVKWDLVHFFHDNPHARDTASKIAEYTGRDTSIIQHELDDLVESEVLIAETVDKGIKIYHLNADEENRLLINQFIDACHDREFRVKAIHHVIRGMQFTPRHDF